MTGRRFSEDEQRLAVSSYLNGQTVVEVSATAGCASTTACRWVREAGYSTNGATKRRSRIATDAERDQMWGLHTESHMTASAIAHELGKSLSTVSAELHRRGSDVGSVYHRAQAKFGLDDKVRCHIKCLYEAGASLNAIAQDYKCSTGAIKTALEQEGITIRNRAQSHGVLFQDRLGRNFCMRSSWEVKTAVWLDLTLRTWDYEREAFLLPSGSRYTPDFWVYEDEQRTRLHYVVDVKGYQRAEQLFRIEEFRSTTPAFLFHVWEESDLRSQGILDLPLPSLPSVGSRCRTPKWKVDAVVDAYLNDGLTLEAAGARVGFTAAGAGYHLRRLKITRSSQGSKQRKSGRGPDWLEAVVLLHHAGVPMNQIGKQLGVNSGTIHYHLKRAGVI